MNALHHLFTGLLYLVILLHPRGTVYCFRPRSPSISRSSRKKTAPPRSASCSSSSPPSSPLRPPAKAEKKPPPSYQSHAANLYTHEQVSHQRSCCHVLELDPSEFAAGVAQKMFERGWSQMGVAPPAVHKILKIYHSSEALMDVVGFECYRRRVQGRDSSSSISRDDGRLLFDGNEILGYWCCHLPDGPAQLPTMPMPKEILVSRSSWRAYEKMHEDGVEGDSKRRAMFICRTVAGRVGEQRRRRRRRELEGGGGGDVFDSLAVGQDLLVLDARAILPCFIVVFEDGDDKEEHEDGGGSSNRNWSSKSGQPTCSMSWYMRPITK